MQKRQPYNFTIESKLQQLQHVDMDGLWAGMKDRLDLEMPEQEERKGIFWWSTIKGLYLITCPFFLSIMVIALYVGFGYFTAPDPKAPAAPLAVTQPAAPVLQQPATASSTVVRAAHFNRPATSMKAKGSTPVRQESPLSRTKRKPSSTINHYWPLPSPAQQATAVPTGTAPGDTVGTGSNLADPFADLYTVAGMETQVPAHTQTLPDGTVAVTSEGEKALGKTCTAGLPLAITGGLQPYKGLVLPLGRTGLEIAPNPIAPAGRRQQLKGFVAGAAVNLNLPVSRQEMSTADIKGSRQSLIDYLPSVYGQYHFNEKWHVQSEFQWMSPQYTPSITLFNKVEEVSADKKKEQSVILNKLYYLNLPISVHYSPLDNFYAGVGLQYSYLRRSMLVNEKALLQYNGSNWTKTIISQDLSVNASPAKVAKKIKRNNGNNGNNGNPGPVDPGTGNPGTGNPGNGNPGNGNPGNGNPGNGNPGNGNPGTGNPGNGGTGGNGSTSTVFTVADTVAQSFRSSDLRLMLDANYTWKRFNLGLRYNMGLNNYINTTVGSAQTRVNDRNEAFQLYLRYNLLDRRKKK